MWLFSKSVIGKVEKRGDAEKRGGQGMEEEGIIARRASTHAACDMNVQTEYEAQLRINEHNSEGEYWWVVTSLNFSLVKGLVRE